MASDNQNGLCYYQVISKAKHWNISSTFLTKTVNKFEGADRYYRYFDVGDNVNWNSKRQLKSPFEEIQYGDFPRTCNSFLHFNRVTTQ